MSDDIVLNKKESIERCIKQVREYYSKVTEPFEQDFRSQDAIAMNFWRAAEQCINLANHVVKERKLGIPKESRDAFDLLVKAGIVSPDMGRKLVGMVGFRNVLIHEYQRMDIAIMVDVIENHLGDLVEFTTIILRS